MSESVLALKNIYNRKKSSFLLALKILISGGLLYIVFRTVEFNTVVSAFGSADLLLIFAAFLLGFVNIYLQFKKWDLVCNTLLQVNDKRKIIRSLFYGFSAGSFTPARVGEYAGRTIPFNDKPLMQVGTAVLIDKLFSLLVVLVLGSFGFLMYLKFSYVTAAVIITSSAILIYFVLQGLKPVLPLSKFKWSRKIHSAISVVKNINAGFSIKLTVLSLLFYLCFILQFALLIGSFTNHSDLLNYIWIANLVMFTKTVIPQITFGELGIREGAAVYFLSHFGESPAAGLNAALFLLLINILFPAIIGLIFLLKRK